MVEQAEQTKTLLERTIDAKRALHAGSDRETLLGVEAGVAEILFSEGHFDEALAILGTVIGELGEKAHSRSLKNQARILFILGQYNEATTAFDAYARKSEEEIKHYQEFLRTRVRPDEPEEDRQRPGDGSGESGSPAPMTKTETLAALVAIREAHGEAAIKDEAHVRLRYPHIHLSCLQQYGNWPSAAVFLERYQTTESIARLAHKLRRKPWVNLERLQYYESMVVEERERKLLDHELYERQEKAKRLIELGKKDRALQKIEGIRADYTWSSIVSGWCNSMEAYVAFNEVSRLVESGKWDEALKMLDGVCTKYPNSTRVLNRGSALEQGILLLAGRYDQLVEMARGVAWDPDRKDARGRRVFAYWTMFKAAPGDRFANFAMLAGVQIRGIDIMLYYPNWDLFPLYSTECEAYWDEQLHAFSVTHGNDLLSWALDQYPKAKYSRYEALYEVTDLLLMGKGFRIEEALRQSKLRSALKRLRNFSDMPGFYHVLKNIAANTRTALRAAVGKLADESKWKKEARMLQMLRSAVHPLHVEAQATFPWLGQFRFDAYVPKLKLAVEYQGAQHFRAIEVFGGEDGLRRTQERDEAKARLALSNGVRVEYVRYDDDLEQRIAEIVASHADRPKPT